MAWAAVGLTVCSGCAVPWAMRSPAPDQYRTVRDQLVLHSDFPLATHHRLIEELLLRRSDLCRHLDLPVSDESIDIYLFDRDEPFAQFLRKYNPRLPARRAFFVETDTHLAIYARWGHRIGEDLRHEVTHGFLHAVVPNLPLWLDEGLAEYYETPRGRQGLNDEHLAWFRERLAAGDWRPNLERLEQLSPEADMSQPDYAEAWAWVHMLLQSGAGPRDLLRAYLGDLRRDGQALPISQRLRTMGGAPEAMIMEHLNRAVSLDAASNAGNAARTRL